MSARKVSAPLAKLREITARNVANGEPVFVEITPLAAMEATAEGYRADLERESDRLIQAQNDLREAVGLLRRNLDAFRRENHDYERIGSIDSTMKFLARIDGAREGGGE